MAITHLVVTRPPLRDDVAPAAAPLLGLDIFEAKQFLRHPLPDVVQAAGSAAEAFQAAAPFRTAGVTVDVVPVQALTDLPGVTGAAGFRLLPEGIAFRTEGGEIELPWNALKLLVIMRGTTTTNVVAFGTSNVVDQRVASFPHGHLFARHGGETHRLVLDQRHLDFAGLGDLKKPGSWDNFLTLLGIFRERAPQMPIDERLTKTNPRESKVDGKLLASLLGDEPENVRRVLGRYDGFFMSYLAVRTLDPRKLFLDDAASALPSAAGPLTAPVPAAASPLKLSPPVGAVSTPKPPPPSAPPPDPKSSATTPSPAPAIKAFCEKCFKEVAIGPGKRCPTCGADLSEDRKHKDLVKERAREGKSALEMIGIALAVLGGILTIGALRGGKKGGPASGVLAILLPGLLLTALGCGLYGLGYWLKWRDP